PDPADQGHRDCSTTEAKHLAFRLVPARDRFGGACERARGIAKLADSRFHVEELLLTLHRALVDPALFGGHLVEDGVGLSVGELARREARRVAEQSADLRLLEQRARTRCDITDIGTPTDPERTKAQQGA